MININLNVNIRGVNSNAEEKIRLTLRQETLRYVVEACERAFAEHGLAFNRTDIGVTGEIVLKDQ